MLQDEEVRNLIRQAQQGNGEAKEKLVHHNINLVRSIVHRFTNRGYEWDDLFQIGCIGLVKAIDRFNDAYSVKFSTYAVPMIIGEIKRFMRDDNPVKVSRPTKELAYRAHRAHERLQTKWGREPTIIELAAELSLQPQEVVTALEAVQPPASLYDQTLKDNGDAIHLLDQIKCNDYDPGSTCFDNFMLRELVARLPEKERKVIELRFFADKTQAQVATILHVSQVQVSRLEKQALKMMKELMEIS